MTPVRVQLHVRTAEEGGRHGPIATGYRAGCWIEPIDPDIGGNDGIITVEGADLIAPGSDGIASMHFLHPELVQHKLRPGSSFDIREGRRVVATAVVLSPQ